MATIAGFELPNRKSEEYRYTDLTPLASMEFVPLSKAPSSIPGTVTNAAVILWNGQPLINPVNLPTGVRVKTVAPPKAPISNKNDERGISVLNQAWAPITLDIEIAEGASVEALEILHLCGESGRVVASHPRISVRVAARAKASIIERFVAVDSANESVYWTNSFTEVVVGTDAFVSYGRLANGGRASWYTGRTSFSSARGSTVEAFVMGTGAKTQRHEFVVDVAAENAAIRLFGLSLVEPGQHIDQFTLIDHRVPECTSEQVFKSIVSEGARSVFHGRVFIRKGAHRTSVKQLNKNILLGPKAEADTRPQLEISDDDVKATHGATVGQLSQDELFYLQARGIPPQVAVSMVARGFAEDSANHFSNESFRALILREVRDAVSNFKAGLPK